VYSVNPVWTVANGSLFELSCTAQDFFASSEGMAFFIKDYDKLSKNEIIAKLIIPQNDLLELAAATPLAQRIAFPLQIMPGNFKLKSKFVPPQLFLRVRHSTPPDTEFIQTLHANQKSNQLVGIYAGTSFVSPQAVRVQLLQRETKTKDGIKVVRIHSLRVESCTCLAK
jgi:hypothetical protein